MQKKIAALALAGAFILPGTARAGGEMVSLEEKIETLTRQLGELKAQMAEMNDNQREKLEEIDRKSDRWDAASRFHWSGDFRSRYDYYSRDRLTNAGTVTDRNTSLLTNRLRLNTYVQALENVEFIGRLAMYKAWGMQSAPDTPGDPFGSFPPFDGNSGRQPADDALRVDRAFANWNDIGGTNFWFSVGRRPTTDGPPSQLRLGTDSRMATPAAYMDWPFDGLTIGYAYERLFNLDAPGRIRFCYGRGFESGLGDTSASTLKDTDFAGISWDIYRADDRFLYFQSYIAMDVFNYPSFANADAVVWAPIVAAMGPRRNIGNIYHTSAMFMDKWHNLNYFLAGGWSRTDPDEDGMLNDFLSPTPANTSSENGYSVYLGARYDFPESPFKLGLEFNHGSRNWIGMSPGHDDMYASKLATRGQVYEVYGIYDIPGWRISRLGRAFIRAGYQHYNYDYTGSMDWNLKPRDVNDPAEVAGALMLGQTVIKSADQVYVTFETRF